MKWSANLAYAIGLIARDGSLSKDGRHIDLTSKDLDQLNAFKNILDLKVKIAPKSDGRSDRKYYRVQFGNVKLYRFLIKIGLMPNKSKMLGSLKIPNRFFRDFLRGHFDGDGSSYSYWDKRWKSSFMLYLRFTSASSKHLQWLRDQITINLGIVGIIKPGNRCFNLEFAKYSSLNLVKKIYYKEELIFLKRKYLKIKEALGIISTQAGMAKSEDA